MGQNVGAIVDSINGETSLAFEGSRAGSSQGGIVSDLSSGSFSGIISLMASRNAAHCARVLGNRAFI